MGTSFKENREIKENRYDPVKPITYFFVQRFKFSPIHANIF
jgi:hypothetical protein